MAILILINTLTFSLLSSLHVYWAFGGRWAWEPTVPTKMDGKKLFAPTAGSTLLVAIGLLIFAIVTLGNFRIFDSWIDMHSVRYGMWIIITIFLVRAIGDFKFVGFTKKIKHTPFAIKDNKVYSPLCLGIALFSFLIVLFQ